MFQNRERGVRWTGAWQAVTNRRGSRPSLQGCLDRSSRSAKLPGKTVRLSMTHREKPRLMGSKGCSTLCGPSATILSRLCTILQSLSIEHRRMVLAEHFSQPQRLALEHWMLTQAAIMSSQLTRATRPTFCKAGDAIDSPELPEREPRLKVKQSSRRALKRRTDASCHRWQTVHQVARSTTLSHAKTVPAMARSRGQRMPRTPACQSGAGIFGIMRNQQAGACYFSAQLAVGNLRLMSKADRSLQVVLRYRAALLGIRDCLGSLQKEEHEDGAEGGCSSVSIGCSFEEHFQKAVAGTLAHCGLDARGIGLRFKVSFRLLWVARPLCTRAYSVSEEMHTGMKAWRRLLDARGCICSASPRSHVLRTISPQDLDRDWQRFRDTYAAVMHEAGCKSGPVQCRLDALRAEQLAERDRQAEAWNRERMEDEEDRVRLQSRHCPDQVHDAQVSWVGSAPCGQKGRLLSGTHTWTGKVANHVRSRFVKQRMKKVLHAERKVARLLRCWSHAEVLKVVEW
mmetsp:Transcript_119755/g.382252  ORF Transcript_119755/g.382252 Transcript_119755/m.382252 type:complete len:512 (-) Transcript_119755:431-1966(-)